LMALRGFLDIMELLDRIEHVTSVHTSGITCLTVF
jgi:hypothetical protein